MCKVETRVHIFALFGFAVAQPLFDLLSKNADFLVAHDLRPLDLLILASILSLLLPSLLVLVETFGSFLHRRVGDYAHWLVVGVLVSALALQVSKKLFGGPGIVLLVGSVVVGLFSGWVSCRVRLFQSFLTFLSPAIVLFPALFLLRPPVLELLVFEEPKAKAAPGGASSDIPIVMVVFDELSTSSLLNEQRLINAFRYPNFAALAQDAHWFRNASTVAERSSRALPAILTGRYAKKDVPPIAANYPENLFTWLGANYELNSFESFTNLCPEKLCRELVLRETFGERIRTTLLDLWFIYLHLALPTDLTHSLPAVTATMRNFADSKPRTKATSLGERKRRSRDWVFLTFVNWIQPSDSAVLYFLHTLLPHAPWTHLPSGKVTHLFGITQRRWGSDEWQTVQGFQRHLLQVQYADRLLGTLNARLREVGLYDRSLIVVTADHGLGFWPNESRRAVAEKNRADILAVPLFVKLPHQQEAVVSDRNVEIIDILPTIADVLQAKLPWTVDGQSTLGPPQSERSQKQMFRRVPRGVEHLVFKPGLEELANTVRRKISLFGSGEDPRSIYRIGRFRSLVGRKIEQLAHAGTSDLELKLKAEWSFREVDLDGPFLPAHIEGRIIPRQRSLDRLHLAVAVNGRIEAVTQTYQDPESAWSFIAMVPETVFKAGSNQVEVFVISESEDGPSLASIRMKKKDALRYSLTQAESGAAEELIVSSTGRAIRIVPGAMAGWVDWVQRRAGHIRLGGWASDGAFHKPADQAVVFVDGEADHYHHTVVPRSDVAKHFKMPSMVEAGFWVVVPGSIFDRDPLPVVRVFAISANGVASELRYRPEYSGGSWTHLDGSWTHLDRSRTLRLGKH